MDYRVKPGNDRQAEWITGSSPAMSAEWGFNFGRHSGTEHASIGVELRFCFQL
jgi:hypothetical protein